jgi:hypothetical protein
MRKEPPLSFSPQKVLEKRRKRSVGPVFEVSAANQLERRGLARDWGMLVAALEHPVQGSGRQLLQEACDQRVQRMSEQLLASITEEREALELPMWESEQRIAVMIIPRRVIEWGEAVVLPAGCYGINDLIKIQITKKGGRFW